MKLTFLAFACTGSFATSGSSSFLTALKNCPAKKCKWHWSLGLASNGNALQH